VNIPYSVTLVIECHDCGEEVTHTYQVSDEAPTFVGRVQCEDCAKTEHDEVEQIAHVREPFTSEPERDVVPPTGWSTVETTIVDDDELPF